MTETEPSARAALDALPGLTWAHWTAADLPDISAMLTAVEAVDQPSERHSLTELVEDFGSQVYDLARDCLLARNEDGEVVAIARSIGTDSDVEVRRSLLAGAVRPDHRRHGIGRAVLAWQLAHARSWYAAARRPEHGPHRMSLFADREAEPEHRLAQRFGLRRVRYYAELTLRDITGAARPDAASADVAGIEIRPWATSTPEETLAVRNAAFRDHWGSVPRTLAGWTEQVASAHFRPEWSFVAVDPDSATVVGFVMSTTYEQDWEPQGYTSGYLDLVGTLRAYRGRGIASALINRAIAGFADAGLDAAEIGVDAENPTGAFGLYSGLGFEETSGTVQFMLEE